MTSEINILGDAPTDPKQWSWAPWGKHSKINPFSYFSTKKLEWIQTATDWTLLIGAVFIGSQVFLGELFSVTNPKTFKASLIGEVGCWMTKLLALSALNCRRILVVKTEKWGEESLMVTSQTRGANGTQAAAKSNHGS